MAQLVLELGPLALQGSSDLVGKALLLDASFGRASHSSLISGPIKRSQPGVFSATFPRSQLVFRTAVRGVETRDGLDLDEPRRLRFQEMHQPSLVLQLRIPGGQELGTGRISGRELLCSESRAIPIGQATLCIQRASILEGNACLPRPWRQLDVSRSGIVASVRDALLLQGMPLCTWAGDSLKRQRC